MRKSILRTVTLILLVLCLACLLLLLSTLFSRGGGFLDLSNMVRYVLSGLAAFFAAAGLLTGKLARRL